MTKDEMNHKMVQKKRRKVKGSGYMENFNRDSGNVKVKGDKSGDT